jgi:cytochrome c biogenesis protein
VLARDLQQVVLYDSEGHFAGVRRPGSGKPQEVEGQWFVIDEILGSSGMQLKSDPGTGVVYTGFAMLMITTIVSYMSHSQVWALQEGDDLHVGGRTNRAVAVFQAELGDILDGVPERTKNVSSV